MPPKAETDAYRRATSIALMDEVFKAEWLELEVDCGVIDPKSLEFIKALQEKRAAYIKAQERFNKALDL